MDYSEGLVFAMVASNEKYGIEFECDADTQRAEFSESTLTGE